MNVVDYRKFFEGTVDILNWEEFEEFMERRRVIGEEDISDRLKGFPLLGMLGCDDEGRHLVRVKEPIELTSNHDHSYPSGALLKFIKKYGPYMYGDWVELIYNNTKLDIVLMFAWGELRVVSTLKEKTRGFKVKVDVLAEKVENSKALKTDDGILFQRTPIGVILYDRHEHYLNSIDGIYAYYS